MAGGGWWVANRTANAGIYRMGEWASRRMETRKPRKGTKATKHKTPLQTYWVLGISYWVLIRRAWGAGLLVSRPAATGDRAFLRLRSGQAGGLNVR